MTIVKALKSLYVKLGGSLTDTYDDIADGASVSNYSVTSDMIEAISKVDRNECVFVTIRKSENDEEWELIDGDFNSAKSALLNSTPVIFRAELVNAFGTSVYTSANVTYSVAPDIVVALAETFVTGVTPPTKYTLAITLNNDNTLTVVEVSGTE